MTLKIERAAHPWQGGLQTEPSGEPQGAARHAAERINDCRRLKAEGHGYRSIAATLGATRHQVRHWLKEADRKARPLSRLQGEIEPQTASEFAERITSCWRKSVEAIFEVGRLLMAAKERLVHGEFESMVHGNLPFSAGTARRLMAVARDERLSNPAHAPLLPASWMTLYELTKLDDAALQARIADGTVRPDMQRRDISTAAKQARRDLRERDLAGEILALPDKRYGVILADPEWRFEPWSRSSGLDRSADNHYPTSVTEVIAARPVQEIAARDCILFLWATVPMLPHALAVMEAWGFDYRTNFTWAKDHVGTGHWNRNAHEHLLVGIKGDVPAPAPGTQCRSLIDGHVRAHSVKPDCFLEMIEAYFPTLPKIELNRRGPARAGWDGWGNETETEMVE